MYVTSLHRTLGIAATVLGLVSACSPAAPPISDSPRDASNPKAPEGVTPATAASTAPASPPLPTGSGPSHEGHDPHDAGAQSGVVYACPMHPEVTSNQPGVCPKCNMKLVPKK